MSDETGREPTRSELTLIRSALRQDWPVPPAVKAQILQRLIDYLDRETDEGATCSDRLVIAAAKTFVEFMRLSVEQQRLDLAEAKQAGRRAGRDLTELVGEAEKRAIERMKER